MSLEIDLHYTIYQRSWLVNGAHARKQNAVHIFLYRGIFVVLCVHFTFYIFVVVVVELTPTCIARTLQANGPIYKHYIRPIGGRRVKSNMHYGK